MRLLGTDGDTSVFPNVVFEDAMTAIAIVPYQMASSSQPTEDFRQLMTRHSPTKKCWP